MDRAKYERHLASPAWRATRAQVITRDGGACVLCASREQLHVHHRTYARLGAEALADLTTLCKTCHDTFHRSQRVEQAIRRNPDPVKVRNAPARQAPDDAVDAMPSGNYARSRAVTVVREVARCDEATAVKALNRGIGRGRLLRHGKDGYTVRRRK